MKVLEPENDNGNVEYKRHLSSQDIYINSSRFHQLVTQMKFRVSEGNGLAIYYLGIEDNGYSYNLSKVEKIISMKNLKKIVKYLDYQIGKVIFNKYYIKIEIKEKKIFPEFNVLILGPSNSGKTTLLAYLLKNKRDNEKCKARMFILNHKHELEDGKTSSYTYLSTNHNNKRIVFIDTPGDSNKKNNGKRDKVLLNIRYDLIIMCQSKEKWDLSDLYYYYAIFNKIPILKLNLFDSNCIINLVKPKDRLDYLDLIISKIKEQNNNCDFYFNLVQTFPHPDLGVILSGYLEGSEIEVNNKYYWNGEQEMLVKSIHYNGVPVQKINGNKCISITLDNLSEKIKNGFISSIKIKPVKQVKLIFYYVSDLEILDYNKLTVLIKNQKINLTKETNYYLSEENIYYNSLFIFNQNNYLALGKIIF